MARREALEALADGSVAPKGSGQVSKAFTTLKRFLRSRANGEERALAVKALARLKHPRVYDLLLDRLEKERDDRVLKATAEVFRLAPPKLAEPLARRIQAADDPMHRAALLRVLGALPGPEARRRIRLRATMADDWCPRATAVIALRRDRGDAALKPAVALLDSSDPALLTAAIETLVYHTGKKFGRDPIAWKTWWNTRGAVGSVEKAIEEARGERRTFARDPERKTIAGTFFGIPIKGPKVCFVFDTSASMRYKLPIAFEQLSRSIKSLPSTAMFDVVFFNEHAWPWRGRLSHADPVTKRQLIDHLKTIEIKSYTNLFDSVEKALAMNVDEIFVISDGAPNRGRKQFPRDIRRELKKLNTRATRIHTVSVVRVVDGEEHIELLAGIASDHNGQHVQRTLK